MRTAGCFKSQGSARMSRGDIYSCEIIIFFKSASLNRRHTLSQAAFFAWSNTASTKSGTLLYWHASNAAAIPPLIEHTLSFARMSIADFHDCIDDKHGSYTVIQNIPLPSYARGQKQHPVEVSHACYEHSKPILSSTCASLINSKPHAKSIPRVTSFESRESPANASLNRFHIFHPMPTPPFVFEQTPARPHAPCSHLALTTSPSSPHKHYKSTTYAPYTPHISHNSSRPTASPSASVLTRTKKPTTTPRSSASSKSAAHCSHSAPTKVHYYGPKKPGSEPKL